MAITITEIAVNAGVRVKVLKVLCYKPSAIPMGRTYVGNTKSKIKKGTEILLDSNMNSSTIVDMKTTDDGRFIVSTQTSVYLIEKV